MSPWVSRGGPSWWTGPASPVPPQGLLLAPGGIRAMPLRVLVVDDYADTRHSLRLLLKSWGHSVREAADGANALREAEVFRPDVVVLDIAMPGLSGYQVARQLHETSSPRPLLVALTGHTRPEIGRAH